MSEQTVTFTGEVVAIEYSNGEPKRFLGCENCDCQFHDDPPYPKGQYITVQLDDEGVKVWMGPATVTGVAR